MKIRLGTRGSQLAMWQATWTADRIAEMHDGVEVEIVRISTSGDRSQSGPIGELGSQGVFTKEIQRALLDEEIDIAVHSLKDLPTAKVDGLALAAVPARGPHGDAFVSVRHASFEELPPGAIVGTGSFRRRAQLLNARPDLDVRDVRGNVETRLRKLDEGQYDAILLAEAGLVRLGLADRITHPMDMAWFLPAVGQGALGIEARSADEATRSIVAPLIDRDTFAAVRAERAMLNTLEGGCLAPIGVRGTVDADQVRLVGRVLDREGKHSLVVEQVGSIDQPEALGDAVAEDLLARGAGELINDSRRGA